MDGKNNRSKPIRAWKNFEVGALYRYANTMGNTKRCTSAYPFWDITDKDFRPNQCVYPDELLVFLGDKLCLHKSLLKILCFLHPKTGKVVACPPGKCLFYKVCGANE